MSLRGGRSLALGAALAATGCAFGRDLLAPAVCAKPVVSRGTVTANPTNVLGVFVTSDVRDADSALVRFGVNAVLDSATPAFTASDDSVLAPVLGLFPSTTYRAQVVAFNRCGSTAGDRLPFTTGSLPGDLPVYTGSGSGPSPGYVVFAAGNYGLVIDNTGRVVWYRYFANSPGLNFQPQPNGTYAARPPVALGEVASWLEIAPDGSVARTVGCARGLPPRLHDMIAQTDGSYWLLCDDVRTVDLSAQGKSSQARVMGTSVQWRRATGEVLFEWSPFDHLEIRLSVLDPVDLAGSVINWTHGNALDLDSDGNLLVSFRNLGEVTKIDTRSGAIIWRMGGVGNEFSFENANVPPFAHQHGVRAAAGDTLVLLDNLGDPAGSRAERYAYDRARRAARLSRSYVPSAALVAQIGGSTQSLPNGHTLVSFGSGGGVEEYDAAGTMVWRLAGNPGYVFRAQRIRSLYRPGVGIRGKVVITCSSPHGHHTFIIGDITMPFLRLRATGLTLATLSLVACSDRGTDVTNVRRISPSAASADKSSDQSFPTELATVGWQAEARSLVASHSIPSSSVATRMYALVSVAVYGAVVDADTHENDDNRFEPNDVGDFGDGGRAQFDARRGAVAGASAQVLTYLFPDDAAALEQRVSDEGHMGPGGVQPHFTRGVAVGRAFGDRMIQWAKADGFSKPWTGTIPVGPGFWTSAPNVPPAGPQFGAMKPYFLTGPAQFHPAPPPAFGSADYLANLAEVSTISLTRTPAQVATAILWNLPAGTVSALGYWDQLASQYIGEHRFDEQAAAHVFALMNAAAMDAVIGCWEAKYSYFFIRPPQANPAITLPIGLPNHPSYPSGHSCTSAAATEVLSAFFPEHAATLNAQVTEAGLSRIYAGIHYRFDITAGQTLGGAAGKWALAYDRANGLLAAVK